MEAESLSRRWYWPISLRVTLYQMVVATILVKIVPRFGEVYRHVKIPLPWATLFLVKVGAAAEACPWVIYPAILLSPVLLCRRSRKAASTTEAVAIVLLGLLLLWMVYALFSPLLSCSHGIGAKKY